ncbi:hypothetical protein ACRALDRAFT_1072864 [Sodiomyces alcalophilus JCM 7366]|uniref:uncharacterized protein n=1 Tax=Sodiomyces alcalophilus JCM 7366 TaxID=591952 RepID=UPI0039B67EAB
MVIFAHTVRKLFRALATWRTTRDRDGRHPGLTLEVSTYSPSDSQHAFGWYNFAHDPYSEPSDQFTPVAASNLQISHNPPAWRHSCCDGPVAGQEVAFMTRNIERVLGPGGPCFNAVLLDLPKVEVVTTLLVRWQNFRRIDPSTASYMIRRLGDLERIHFEPHAPYTSHQALSARTHLTGFVRSLESSLTALSDSGPTLSPTRSSGRAPGSGNFRASRQGIYQTEAIYRSAYYESQHVGIYSGSTFAADALGFLEYEPNPDPPLVLPIPSPVPQPWSNLRSLALTSIFLRPGDGKTAEGISELLQTAATATMDMHSLDIMEIWNGEGDHQGCLFRYFWDKKDRGQELAPEVIDSWESAADRRSSEPLQVHRELMTMDDTWFPVSVLRHLHLRDRVLHPVTLRQFQHSCSST